MNESEVYLKGHGHDFSQNYFPDFNVYNASVIKAF